MILYCAACDAPLTERELELSPRLTLDGREERICRECEVEAMEWFDSIEEAAE